MLSVNADVRGFRLCPLQVLRHPIEEHILYERQHGQHQEQLRVSLDLQSSNVHRERVLRAFCKAADITNCSVDVNIYERPHAHNGQPTAVCV